MFAGQTAVIDRVLDEAAADNAGGVLGVVVVQRALVETFAAQQVDITDASRSVSVACQRSWRQTYCDET